MANVQAALRTAIKHIEHMAAWIAEQKAGYSFESLGEDMPGIKAALTTESSKDTQRLDFLDRLNASLNAHYGTHYRWTMIVNHNINRLMLGGMIVDLNDAEARPTGLPSCRDAIDAVMVRAGCDRRPDAGAR